MPIPSFITTSRSCGGHHAISYQSPALIQQSILHPVQHEPRHLPGEADRSLPSLGHQGPCPGLDLLAGPWCRHQLHHGGVVWGVAGVRHYELRLVHHEVRYLAGNNARSGCSEDGFISSNLVNISADLPLQLQDLRNTLLDILGPANALLQAVSPADQLRLVCSGQVSSQGPRSLKLKKLSLDILQSFGHLGGLHVKENDLVANTCKDHGPALPYEARPNNSNFLIFEPSHV